MTKFALSYTANLRNLKRIKCIPTNGVEFEVQLHCEHCGEEVVEPCVVVAEKPPILGNPLVGVGQRNVVHRIAECDDCGRVGTVRIVRAYDGELYATAAYMGGYRYLALFEFDGLMPKTCLSIGGTWLGYTMDDQIVDLYVDAVRNVGADPRLQLLPEPEETNQDGDHFCSVEEFKMKLDRARWSARVPFFRF